MSNIAKQFNVGGFTVEIHHDDSAEDPRKEHCNVGTMACWHRRSRLGDVQPSESGKDYLAGLPDDEFVLPVYAYDHGSMILNTTGFSCPWDSGQLGLIHCSMAKAREEWPGLEGDELRKRVEACLRSEVETYSQYISGDVYGYVIKDEDGEHVDSCWGYYGMEHCVEDATSAAKHLADKFEASV